MEGVVEFPEGHPADGDSDLFDLRCGVDALGRFYLMAYGAAGESGALAVGEVGALVGEEDHVLEILAGFILALDAFPFPLDVSDEFLAAGDAFDVAAEFLVLDVEAAEKGADVVGIAVGEGKAWGGLVELEGVALGAVLLISDGLLVFAAAVLLVAIGAIELARHGAFAHVDGVVELEGVGVLDLARQAVLDLAELGVIRVEGVDDLCVAALRANAGGDFAIAAAGEIREGVRAAFRAEIAGFRHEIGVAVAGNAVGAIRGRHEAAGAVFLVALLTGEIRGHVRLVELHALVAGEAALVHGGGLNRAALDEIGGGESFLEGTEGLCVP